MNGATWTRQRGGERGDPPRIGARREPERAGTGDTRDHVSESIRYESARARRRPEAGAAEREETGRVSRRSRRSTRGAAERGRCGSDRGGARRAHPGHAKSRSTASLPLSAEVSRGRPACAR